MVIKDFKDLFSPSMEDTETALMLELKNGSLKAFDRIYDLYARRLYAYCYRCTRSRQDSEEIVQDVFVNLWRYHTEIDPSRSLSTLLFTIARRYRINAFRSLVNSPVYEDYLDYRDAIASDSQAGIEYTEFVADIHKALRKLPDRQRRIIILSKFKNMNHSEIGHKLNISEKTVRNLLSTGLKTLRNELKHILPHIIILWFSI